MPQKGDRSARRRPRKGFPHRIVGYVDRSTHELVARAAEQLGESLSTFVAKAAKDRAEGVLRNSRVK
jgi:uncharacterized protein (DUF1778 family)